VRAGKEEVEGPAAKSVRYRWRVAEVTAAVVARGYTAVQSAPVILWTKDALLVFEEDSAADVQVRAVGLRAGLRLPRFATTAARASERRVSAWSRECIANASVGLLGRDNPRFTSLHARCRKGRRRFHSSDMPGGERTIRNARAHASVAFQRSHWPSREAHAYSR
jgi:hypothetical protein